MQTWRSRKKRLRVYVQGYILLGWHLYELTVRKGLKNDEHHVSNDMHTRKAHEGPTATGQHSFHEV